MEAAHEIFLATTEVKVSFNDQHVQSCVKQVLLDKSITIGDFVYITLGTKMVPFQIVSTIPSAPVVVKQATRILVGKRFSEEIMKIKRKIVLYHVNQSSDPPDPNGMKKQYPFGYLFKRHDSQESKELRRLKNLFLKLRLPHSVTKIFTFFYRQFVRRLKTKGFIDLYIGLIQVLHRSVQWQTMRGDETAFIEYLEKWLEEEEK